MDDKPAILAFVADLLFHRHFVEPMRRANLVMRANPEQHFRDERKRREQSAMEAWTERRDIAPLADLIAHWQGLLPDFAASQ